MEWAQPGSCQTVLGPRSWEPLIDSAAHLRHIFSRLLLAEKLDVHPVHLEFFAIADEKICTESAPPHSISVSVRKNSNMDVPMDVPVGIHTQDKERNG